MIPCYFFISLLKKMIKKCLETLEKGQIYKSRLLYTGKDIYFVLSRNKKVGHYDVTDWATKYMRIYPKFHIIGNKTYKGICGTIILIHKNSIRPITIREYFKLSTNKKKNKYKYNIKKEKLANLK